LGKDRQFPAVKHLITAVNGIVVKTLARIVSGGPVSGSMALFPLAPVGAAHGYATANMRVDQFGCNVW